MILRAYRSLSHRFTSLMGNAVAHRICGAWVYPHREFGVPRTDIRLARSILVLKPDEIGDVVLATGFLGSLREQCPLAHITIAVRRHCAEVVSQACFGDEVVFWEDSWRGLRLEPRQVTHLVRSAYQRWHNAPPDWVVIPRGGGDHVNAAFYAWWSGGVEICAHESFCRDWGLHRVPLVNRRVPSGGTVHEIEFHRRMLAYLGLDAANVRPRLEIPAQAKTEADAIWQGASMPRDVIALGIGASTADKRWPLENFKALACEINRLWPHLGIVIIGGAAERTAGEEIRNTLGGPVMNAAGQLSILGTAALLQRCGLYVGNDSGPAHLAAAAGCGVITISKHPRGGALDSSYSPLRFGPVAHWSRALQPEPLGPECASECSRSYTHCIVNVKVQDVLDAMAEGIKRAAAQ